MRNWWRVKAVLALPSSDDRSSASILGLDPGSETLGAAILTFDLATLAIIRFEAATYYGSKLPSRDWTRELYNERAQRIEAHYLNLTRLLRQVQPLAIASEAPFFNGASPNAFGALTEVVCALRQAVNDYDVWKHLYMIDPPSVKVAVGAPGGTRDKLLVKTCMAAIPQLMGALVESFATWDEHSVDAGAVAYCQYRRMFFL